MSRRVAALLRILPSPGAKFLRPGRPRLSNLGPRAYHLPRCWSVSVSASLTTTAMNSDMSSDIAQAAKTAYARMIRHPEITAATISQNSEESAQV